MTQKPTKKESVGFLNLLPYSVIKAGISLVQFLSHFPQPITRGVITLVGSPLLLIRLAKKRLRR